jgi:branched-chain amino acid transport system substrate-binding protein
MPKADLAARGTLRGNNVVSRKALIFGGALVAVLALAGCSTGTASGGSTSAAAKGTFNVYMNTPLTGALANAATANVEALKVAAAAINKAGGIDGKTVKVTIADDGLDTTKAVTLLQQQIDKQKPDLVYMGATSNEALALLPLLTRNKILSSGLVQAHAINNPTTYPYAFIPYVEGTVDAQAILAKLKAENVKSVAILTANDANGQSAAASFNDAFKGAGISVAAESYTPTDLDMTAQLQRLEAQNPKVLVIQGFGAAVGHILSSRTKIGWTVETLAHSSIGNGQDLSTISSAADWKGLQLMVFPINAGTTKFNLPALANFNKALKAAGSNVSQPEHFYTSYWDSLHLFAKAAAQAKSTDADKMKAALENLKPNAKYDKLLLTFPGEKWSSTDHFYNFPATTTMTFVKPGPLVDGTIQSIK